MCKGLVVAASGDAAGSVLRFLIAGGIFLVVLIGANLIRRRVARRRGLPKPRLLEMGPLPPGPGEPAPVSEGHARIARVGVYAIRGFIGVAFLVAFIGWAIHHW